MEGKQLLQYIIDTSDVVLAKRQEATEYLASLRAENDALRRDRDDWKFRHNEIMLPQLDRHGVTMDKLRAELEEWENAKKFVADGCQDEVHCGCVPILKRENERLTKAVEEAEVLIERSKWYRLHPSIKDYIEWLEKYGKDVTHEGNTKGAA